MRRVALASLLVVVVLAGCLGGPGSAPADESPADGSTDVAPDDVPGVSNQTLANATALAQANEGALFESGGELRIDQASASFRMALGTGLSTYSVSRNRSVAGRSSSLDLWSNETDRFVRIAGDGAERYRSTERDEERLTIVSSVATFVAGGEFTVQNESAGNGTVVLAANSYSPTAGAAQFDNVSSYDGRLVVSGDGLIHNLTVTTDAGGQSRTYRYELVRSGIDRVDPPAWLDDVPPTAGLDPQLRINVENDSLLVVSNDGSDSVPAGSTITLSSNGSSYEATFDSPLAGGEERVAFVDVSADALRLVDERPDDGVAANLASPISVTVETTDGVTLYSASMGWGSETATEASGGSPSGSAQG